VVGPRAGASPGRGRGGGTVASPGRGRGGGRSVESRGAGWLPSTAYISTEGLRVYRKVRLLLAGR
jgi:hypothetical protein